MSELCRFIHAEKANYPIVLLCRVLHVARSSYYAWREGEAARRARQAADDALAHEITVLHLASRKTYGVPRIHAELRRLGRQVNRKRVARVMRERDIRGVTSPTPPPLHRAAPTHHCTRCSAPPAPPSCAPPRPAPPPLKPPGARTSPPRPPVTTPPCCATPD